MDKPDNVISLINLATVRSLEEQWGYRDRSAALSRQFLYRRRQALGGIRLDRQRHPDRRRAFRVDRRNGRCGATNVNPATGRRDLDIPGSLRAAFGHKDLGVYLIVREGGAGRRRRSGVCAARSAPARRRSARAPRRRSTVAQRRFICRGCYFIYEEASGLPQQSISAGNPVRRHSGELAMSRLRNRKNDFPALCREGRDELSSVDYRCSSAIRLDVSQRLPPIACTSE